VIGRRELAAPPNDHRVETPTGFAVGLAARIRA